MASLVVPGISVTMHLSFFSKAFTILLFPTLGRPTNASFGVFCFCSMVVSFGSCSTIKSSKSPVPEPLMEDTGNKFSRPRE
jgi:hypothetical protein